jgi:glucose/arabinose dehydrogenase
LIRATIALTLSLAAFLLGLGAAGAAGAATLQPIGNFEQPIYVTSDPGNPEALFVVERGGRIVKLQGGATTTFADISPVVSTGTEGGLLSIALSPDFDSSGRLYVYYTGTEQTPAEIHIAELRASGGTAPLSSLRDLLTIPHPGQINHYGGQLQLGPEGNLFISTGDGGGANDPAGNAQNLNSLLGKVLRIDSDPGALRPYTVPVGNPFAARPAPYDTIWSYGLRNPFRFSFDQLSGDLWIGDVGQSAREEVDYAVAPGLGGGANYGWNCREGTVAGSNPGAACGAPASPFVDPVFDYPHPSGGCAAIIGGYVVRDASLGDLYGRYLYGDHCGGQLRSFSPANTYGTDRSEGIGFAELDSFGQDSCGRIYAVSGNGTVSRLVGPTPAVCATAAPALLPSFVGIKALRRKVRRNKRALITVWVSPCAGRRGQSVTLLRGRRRLGTRRLDRAFSANFRPRVRHRWVFRASIRSDGAYVGDELRRLKIAILRRHPARERPRQGVPRVPAP